MKILGLNGFENFDGFINNGEKELFRITFDDFTHIDCTNEHRFFIDGEWVYTYNIIIGSIINDKQVVDIEELEHTEEVFDALDVKNSHSYYTNGVFSHNCVYIDETAFVDGWLEFYTSVFPTLSSGKDTKIIFTSTPNGLNHFYKFCEDAKKIGTPEWNGFHYFEVPWWEVPGRDEKWKEETLAAMNYNHDKFAQEFCVAFNGSASTLISGESLNNLTSKSPIHSHDGLSQYVKPEESHTYTLTVDVSRGKGIDYSTIQVIDVTSMPYKQAACYRNNLVSPPDFSKIVYEIAKLYNNAPILVEINDIGEEVPRIIYNEYEYENVLSTESAGRAGKRISGGFGKNVDMGLRTTKSTKAVGCSLLKLLIEQEQLIINDHDTIYELSRFSKKGTSYEAEVGATDDLVMALVLFSWLSDQPYFRDLTDNNTIMALREKTEEDLMAELLPFGIHVDGTEEAIAPVYTRESDGNLWQVSSADEHYML